MKDKKKELLKKDINKLQNISHTPPKKEQKLPNSSAKKSNSSSKSSIIQN